MKTGLLFKAAIALVLCLGLSAGSATAQVLVTFDNPSDLSDNFNSTNNYYTSVGIVGLGGSGAVHNSFVGYNYGSDVDLWTLKSGVPATGGVFTVSAYFFNNSDGGYGGLGFATSNSNAPVGYGKTASGLGMMTHASGGMFANNGVETPFSYGSDVLVSQQWYQITFTVTQTAADTYDLEFQILDSDENGSLGSVVAARVIHNVVNAGFGSAETVYPYFSGDASRMSLIDNFSAPLASPLPIQLSSLTASPEGGSAVTLNWKTASETNNYGFYVERSANKSTGFAAVSGLIPGHGTSTTGFSYQYADKNAPGGTVYYRLKQVDLDNTVHYTDAVMLGATDVAQSAPIVFALSQNYPNPFNPSTQFRFSVAKSGLTTLIVYNMLGQEVSRIFNGETEAGKFYTARLDGTGLASGVYLARLQSGTESQMRKIVLMK